MVGTFECRPSVVHGAIYGETLLVSPADILIVFHFLHAQLPT